MALSIKMKKQHDERTQAQSTAPVPPMNYDELLAQAGEVARQATARADDLAGQHQAEQQRIEALRTGLAALQRKLNDAEEAREGAADDLAVATALETTGVPMDAAAKQQRLGEAVARLEAIRGQVATTERAIAEAEARARELFTKEQEARREAREAPKRVAAAERAEILARLRRGRASYIEAVLAAATWNQRRARRVVLSHDPLGDVGVRVTPDEVKVPETLIHNLLHAEAPLGHLEEGLRDLARQDRQAQ